VLVECSGEPTDEYFRVMNFFVAGSWRNRDAVAEVVDALDGAGAQCYSFVRAQYDDDALSFAAPGGADAARLDEPGIRSLFEQDLAALRAADRFVLVLPAGAAAHIETGIAYGLGKPCYAVGPADRSETLYRLFEAMCTDPADLVRHLAVADARRVR
jgi:hypothetical protein